MGKVEEERKRRTEEAEAQKRRAEEASKQNKEGKDNIKEYQTVKIISEEIQNDEIIKREYMVSSANAVRLMKTLNPEGRSYSEDVIKSEFEKSYTIVIDDIPTYSLNRDVENGTNSVYMFDLRSTPISGTYISSDIVKLIDGIIAEDVSATKGKVEIPSFADRKIGADYPRVLYSDAEKLILHDSYGILVYDYSSRKLVGFADLRPMGMTRIQGDGATSAEVSEDGKYVKIYGLSETSSGEVDPEKMYLYIVDQNSLSQVTSYDETAEYFQPYQIQTKVYDWNGQLETTSESWLGSDGKMVSWKYEDDQGGMYYRNLVLIKETEDGIETYRVFV